MWAHWIESISVDSLRVLFFIVALFHISYDPSLSYLLCLWLCGKFLWKIERVSSGAKPHINTKLQDRPQVKSSSYFRGIVTSPSVRCQAHINTGHDMMWCHPADQWPHGHNTRPGQWPLTVPAHKEGGAWACDWDCCSNTNCSIITPCLLLCCELIFTVTSWTQKMITSLHFWIMSKLTFNPEWWCFD